MLNGDKMIKAIFNDDRFTIMVPLEKFRELWDESYEFLGEYDISRYREQLGILANKIDLNSFVAEQVLSVLDENGNEDESANNEFFENYDASYCSIRDFVDENIIITGRLVSF